jgi:D-sedoheptulose 7-phosphate isomerase
MIDTARTSLAAHRELLDSVEALLPVVDEIAKHLIRVYDGSGRLFSFGNGGSACDAQHLAEELIGRYRRERRPLPATSLSADGSALTCIANDYGFDAVFERQVSGLAGVGDMVAAFTTSGRSPNVVRGLAAAREVGATTVLFGGGDGGPAADYADFALIVPSVSTARVQEMHALLIHVLLDPVDAWAAGETG